MKAPLPPEEVQRLAALRAYAVLDTPAEEAFDDLTLLAAHICQTPIALISLVDETRQWFKSKFGLTTAETPRDLAFCAHAILKKDEVLEVCDTQADPRFSDNLLVTAAPHIRFYAGAPLVATDGQPLGTLCVLDHLPRTLTVAQRAALRALSRHVVAQLELRRHARELAWEVAEHKRAKALLREQFEHLSASKDAADGRLTLARQSRRALLSVLEDEQRTGQHLRASEERFQQLAENIQEVFWITDPARQQMVYISPAYEKIWGRTCASLYQSPHSWLAAVHPEDRPRVRQAVQLRQARGQYDETYRILRPDGAVRWIHDCGFPVRNAAGEIYRMVGTAEDVTGRKQLEEDLRQSEAEFRVTFENAAMGVALVDLAGHALKSNRALQQLLGYSEAELRGLAFREFTHAEDVETDAELFRDLLAGGREHYQIVKRYLRQDGEVVHVRLTTSVVRGPAGRAQYTISMMEDITEKKKLEAQFLRSQRMESIGTLAGGIAHDLNNVLAPILMCCELLQMEARDEESRKLFGMIKGSAERGAELVKQVLSFARGVEGRRVSMQPKHLIREMVDITRETFPKSIRIQAHLPKQLWTLYGDPTQLHQVLLNLCVNARDAMTLGGELTIAAENVPWEAHLPGLVQDAKPGPYLVIKVTDTGTGIPPEIREQIFDPFFTTKEIGKGTGLGLSTTLGIVRSHGGYLNVRSKPGQGSTFEVWLPALTTEDLSPAQVQEAKIPRGHGELILVVDDEASLRTITRQILETYSYVVMTATNGADALAIYRQHQGEIAVVLTDLMMPVMDGAALEIALMKLNPAVRIIATSGLSNPEPHTKNRGGKAKYFLPKPYTTEALLNSLHEILHDR